MAPHLFLCLMCYCSASLVLFLFLTRYLLPCLYFSLVISHYPCAGTPGPSYEHIVSRVFCNPNPVLDAPYSLPVFQMDTSFSGIFFSQFLIFWCPLPCIPGLSSGYIVLFPGIFFVSRSLLLTACVCQEARGAMIVYEPLSMVWATCPPTHITNAPLGSVPAPACPSHPVLFLQKGLLSSEFVSVCTFCEGYGDRLAQLLS